MITWNDFIRNEFKSLLRRPSGIDTLVGKILLLVLVLMIAAYFAVIGYMLPIILKQVKTGQAPLEIINGIMVYYLLADLFMRLLLQQIPAGIITQYLVLNISRKKIVSFLLTKTFTNIPTTVGVTLWCSFSISQFGISIDCALWLASVLLFLLINSLLITILKNSFETGLWGTLTTLGIILTIGGTNYFGVIHFSEVIKIFLHSAVYEHQVLILIPLALLFVLIVQTWKIILSATYKEINAKYSLRRVTSSVYADEFFSYWSFEWKQFWRNRRTKTAFLFQTIIFTFLTMNNIMIFRKESGWMSTLLPFVFLFVAVSVPLIFLQQTVFLRESVFFDKLATIQFSWKKYFIRNYLIGAAVTIIYYLIFLVLLLMMSQYLLVVWASIFVIFHIGITSYLTLYSSTFSKARFRNDTSPWFNYEGAAFLPWYIFIIFSVEYFIVPIILSIVTRFVSEIAAMMFCLIVGITGIAFYKQWFAMLYRGFLKRRYIMMEGFRAVS